jgi:hypothetical protein
MYLKFSTVKDTIDKLKKLYLEFFEVPFCYVFFHRTRSSMVLLTMQWLQDRQKDYNVLSIQFKQRIFLRQQKKVSDHRVPLRPSLNPASVL